VDNHRFDYLARWAATAIGSRRAALAALGSALTTPVASMTLLTGTAGAATCRRIGAGCQRDAQCCSDRCRGRRGHRTCRAHDVGTCRQGENFCRQGSAAACNANPRCACFVTTGGAPFCGDPSLFVACEKDRDCAERGFPVGSACVRSDGPTCETELAAFCVVPCGAPVPG
jgi:hypothetical protein